MATITKRVLSGSTDGAPILVSATTSKLIHTGPSSTNTIDEVYLYLTNSATSNVSVRIELNASASQTYGYEMLPKGNGAELVVPGFIVQGNATPLVINIQSSSSNVIHALGWVNRIVQS